MKHFPKERGGERSLSAEGCQSSYSREFYCRPSFQTRGLVDAQNT